ncbi:MAG: hypothetical protein SFY70_00215 [Bacteroidia bacterium]|nr:hypothetical protein [Bacteroidia bacterium]
MKHVLLIACLLGSCSIAAAQKPLYATDWPGWDLLLQVRFETRLYKGERMYWPVLSDKIKAAHNKPLRLKGYLIPMQAGQTHLTFYLSLKPESECFFCGGGGPESIVEVTATQPVPYSYTPIMLVGTLVVNDSDPNQMLYRLIGAKLAQ